MVAEFERAGIDRSGFETERTLIWQDKATESAPTIWCRARVDLLGDRLILDLKTTAVPATPERWGRNLIWDYAMQCRILPPGLQGAEWWEAPRVPLHRAGDRAPLFGGPIRFRWGGPGLRGLSGRASRLEVGRVHQGAVLAQLCRRRQCDGSTLLGARETGGGIMKTSTRFSGTFGSREEQGCAHEGGRFVAVLYRRTKRQGFRDCTGEWF